MCERRQQKDPEDNRQPILSKKTDPFRFCEIHQLCRQKIVENPNTIATQIHCTTPNRSIAPQTQIAETHTTSAPQRQSCQTSIIDYVHEEQVLVGSLLSSKLVIGQVSLPDTWIGYLASVNQSYSDYDYERKQQNWDAENWI